MLPIICTGKGGVNFLIPPVKSCTSRSMTGGHEEPWLWGDSPTATNSWVSRNAVADEFHTSKRIGPATRAFSAKGGPLLKTHWPRNSGKICDRTNSHRGVGSTCDRFHTVLGGGCFGAVKFLSFTQYWAEKLLQNMGLKETQNPKTSGLTDVWLIRWFGSRLLSLKWKKVETLLPGTQAC